MCRSKIFKIAAYISGFLALFTFFSPHLLKLWLTWRFNLDFESISGVEEASSIGIIGGSDGPTTIYLASSEPYLRVGLVVGFTLLSLGFIIAGKHRSPSKS